jgi:hypothetical protein
MEVQDAGRMPAFKADPLATGLVVGAVAAFIAFPICLGLAFKYAPRGFCMNMKLMHASIGLFAGSATLLHFGAIVQGCANDERERAFAAQQAGSLN